MGLTWGLGGVAYEVLISVCVLTYYLVVYFEYLSYVEAWVKVGLSSLGLLCVASDYYVHLYTNFHTIILTCTNIVCMAKGYS